DAAAFIPFTTVTTHTAAGTTPCDPAPTFDEADSEFKGSLLQFRGGMLVPIQLPPGAKGTRLRYTAVDQDNHNQSYGDLLRKKLQAGVPKDAGYLVMATTHTTGNVLTVTRQFNDTTITGAVADPDNYAYYLELVNCEITIEPIGVQVTMTI